MTYNQALMIIRNYRRYRKEQVRTAAVFVLGTLGISQEDEMQAIAALEPVEADDGELAAAKMGNC